MEGIRYETINAKGWRSAAGAAKINKWAGAERVRQYGRRPPDDRGYQLLCMGHLHPESLGVMVGDAPRLPQKVPHLCVGFGSSITENSHG